MSAYIIAQRAKLLKLPSSSSTGVEARSAGTSGASENAPNIRRQSGRSQTSSLVMLVVFTSTPPPILSPRTYIPVGTVSNPLSITGLTAGNASSERA